MRIVIALDSFKGSLSAAAACQAAARGVREVLPEAELDLCPMADGGEGTARTLLDALGGEWVTERVMGPLPEMEVAAGFALLAAGTAVVEMAAASGLALLPAAELDPFRTTTYGTGQLLAAAAQRGAGGIQLAVGGSATVDGGVGAAQALGYRFLDGAGEELGPEGGGLGGGEVERIERIVAPEALDLPPVEVLCDVDNPLTGERGAARVFAPQKGADPAGVRRLEAALAHLAEVVARDLGRDIAHLPGGGAAGGLAAGAAAFFGARLLSGVEAVMAACRLADRLAGAAWVITGEGRLDEQSLGGKVVSGVAGQARAAGARVAVLAGGVELAPERARRAGIAAAYATRPRGMPLEEALARGEELLTAAARRLARERLRPGSEGSGAGGGRP